jgi:hypothetical protein
MRSRGNEVTEAKYEVLGPILADVGGELTEIAGGNPDGVYLYVEAGEGWVGPSVFKDDGDVVRYYDGTPELSELLLKAWKAEAPNKRWAVMEYEINGTTFDVQFQFPDEVNQNETEMDRRPRALKRRFGDKPVIYPPWPREQQ